MSKNLIICFHKITFTALTVSVPHYIFYLQNYTIHLMFALHMLNATMIVFSLIGNGTLFEFLNSYLQILL